MKIGSTIYLDHQATTPIDPRVLEKMQPHLETEFGNPHSKDHAIGWKASKAIDASLSQIASLIGCDTDEIFFTSGATESNNLALLGLCRRRNTDRRRNRILLSSIEHKSILAIGRVLQTQYQYDVQLLPVDSDGRIIVSALERSLDENVFVVSIMAVNNEIGTIQDTALISRMITDVGAIFHSDGAQAPLAINVKTITDYVDLFSLSSHKIYGPKGIGVLYIRRELQNNIEPLIYGGGQQNGIRSGTLPVPLCVGMGIAAQICNSPAAEDERRQMEGMRNTFIKKLLDLPWEIIVNGPVESAIRHPGNVNVCFKGFSAHEILGALQPHLAASTGSACTSGVPEPSHVLAAVGLTDSDAEASIRFSMGRNTTEQTLDEGIALIEAVLRASQSLSVAR